MIQNSLERLLAGVAASLRGELAPRLDDEFARGQALAGAEILENLVPRVQWRADDAEAVIALVAPLLDAPVEGGRDGYLRTLAELQRALPTDDPRRERLLEVALELVERELAHLRAARALSRR